MADWLIEEGIAEHRAVRLAGDEIAEARIDWPGRLAAGWVVDAKLLSRAAGSARGTASAHGEEILVDRLPKHASEGALVRLAITRAALDGPGRLKRAQARPVHDDLTAPTLAERLTGAGHSVRIVRRFPANGWDEVIDEALSGRVAFSGGEMLFAPTAAMTTVDVDGDLPPPALALASVHALASALRRFDLGGSIAVDFPTLSVKGDRRAVDIALGAALTGWPHERTAMNGFGLVQIVNRLERPSLLQLATWKRNGLVWRRLLRRAEALMGPGRVELTIHPSLEQIVQPDHLTELAVRTGRPVTVRVDTGLAQDAPHAQLVTDG